MNGADDEGKVRIKAIMSKQTLIDLSANNQVEIVATAPADLHTISGKKAD